MRRDSHTEPLRFFIHVQSPLGRHPDNYGSVPEQLWDSTSVTMGQHSSNNGEVHLRHWRHQKTLNVRRKCDERSMMG